MNEYHLLGCLVCVGENFRRFAKSIACARKARWRGFSPAQNKAPQRVAHRGQFALVMKVSSENRYPGESCACRENLN